MQSWPDRIAGLQKQAKRIPKLAWAAGGIVLVSAGVVAALEFSGPPYAVLEEGLSPADGGKVIAQLQKLGIPYQLQAAGNVIMVPAPQLAQARLQLGQAQVPGSDSETAWTQLENAPMTASDLAQSTMASQALQLSLQQSIETLNGIRDAQVFLALPPDTPFLADQPKPSASVIITADDDIAQAQGAAIAALVAGAVPGLDANSVTVTTSSGMTVFPKTRAMGTQEQLAAAESVEDAAQARISGLLTALVGAGNFQTGVSANLDFTQDHTHQTVYGPGHVVQHQSLSTSSQTGQKAQAFGIPGAMSNEPPQATTANPAPVPAQGTQTAQGTGTQTQPQAPAQPQQNSSDQDQTYLTDESESDIVKPDWSVKSLAVSVVLNKAALGSITPGQVQSAIMGAFAYPSVSVNVLAAPMNKPTSTAAPAWLAQASEPLTHSILEVLTAIFLLFGVAMPASRRLAGVNLQSLLTLPPPPPLPPVPPPVRPLPPPRDYTELRDRAGENIPGVANLLQSWSEETEG